MKKYYANLLAISLFTCGANAGELYGRLDLSLTYSDIGIGNQTYEDGFLLENFFSRLGYKDNITIDNDNEFIYQVEIGINGEDNEKGSSPFSSRITYIGFNNKKFGQVTFGRMEPSLKAIKAGVDPFDPYNFKFGRIMKGDARMGDLIKYRYSNIDEINIELSYQLKDDLNNKKAESNIDQRYQISLTYGDAKFRNKNYHVGLAYGNGIDDIIASRMVGKLKVNKFIFGTLLQHTEMINEETVAYDRRNGFGFIANASWNVEDMKYKIQYGSDKSGSGLIAERIYNDKAALDNMPIPELKMLAIGAEKKLNPKLKLHAEMGRYMVNSYSNYNDTLFSFGVRYDL